MIRPIHFLLRPILFHLILFIFSHSSASVHDPQYRSCPIRAFWAHYTVCTVRLFSTMSIIARGFRLCHLCVALGENFLLLGRLVHQQLLRWRHLRCRHRCNCFQGGCKGDKFQTRRHLSQIKNKFERMSWAGLTRENERGGDCPGVNCGWVQLMTSCTRSETRVVLSHGNVPVPLILATLSTLSTTKLISLKLPVGDYRYLQNLQRSCGI